MESKTTNRGFTIVELLIVIVVIGILAAITMVSYNGIQNRSKTAAGQQLANSVSKKIQAYYTVESEYPDDTTEMATVPEAELDDASSVLFQATPELTSTTAAGGKIVRAVPGTGQVFYFDYTQDDEVEL